MLLRLCLRPGIVGVEGHHGSRTPSPGPLQAPWGPDRNSQTSPCACWCPRSLWEPSLARRGSQSKTSPNRHSLSEWESEILKGIVHPKMKILSSFTHPQVVPNLYEFLCSAEHKGRYSEECGKQISSGAPLTSIVFFFLLWKSMVPQNGLVTNFLQIIFLCVQQNKEIHTGLELPEGE